MEKNEIFFVGDVPYALVYGGTSEVPDNVREMMRQNSETLARAMSQKTAAIKESTKQSLHSDASQPIGS
jgi:hypothetical protein